MESSVMARLRFQVRVRTAPKQGVADQEDLTAEMAAGCIQARPKVEMGTGLAVERARAANTLAFPVLTETFY